MTGEYNGELSALNLLIFNFFVCFACMYICMQSHACLALLRPEGVMDPLELKLHRLQVAM